MENEIKTETKKSVETIKAPEIIRKGFLSNVFNGLGSLWRGMKVTLHYFVRPSTVVTQQYPENRATLKMMDRFRGQLIMPHDENGYHKCTGCGICSDQCPNYSIMVLGRKNSVTNRTEIDRHIWRMDSCTFCNICVQVCPFNALAMAPTFESSVFDRRLLVYTTNRYAGPPASGLVKIADEQERKQQMEPRDLFGGPVPMAGTSIGGLDAERRM